MKLPMSLARQLERMNADLGTSTDFQARQDLSDQHVGAFLSILRPRVREALEREGQSLIAGDWVAEAERVVREHLFVDIPLIERIVVARAEQDSLAKQLREAAVSIPDDEVEDHATELAQLLLSNWFGLLEHALQDGGTDLLVLDMNALPKTAHLDAVLQGCEAFALPALSSAMALLDYQRSFVRNPITELSPSLYLVRGQHGWQVARTHERATSALHSAQTTAHTSTDAIREHIDMVLNQLRPWALARPTEFVKAAAVRATTPTHALTNEDELRLALEATLQLKLKAVQDELANLATMADIVKVDIADALARKPKPSETWSYEQVFLDLSTVEQDIDPGSIYRIALSCAGLVLSGQPLPAAPQAAARSHLEEQILRCSVATAKMALAGSDLTSFRLALLQADAFGWNQD